VSPAGSVRLIDWIVTVYAVASANDLDQFDFFSFDVDEKWNNAATSSASRLAIIAAHLYRRQNQDETNMSQHIFFIAGAAIFAPIT